MFAGFMCPVCTQTLTREEALKHLPNEHGGVVPAAVVEAIWRNEESRRRDEDHISPSMAGGCMREYMLQRTSEQFIDPRRTWKMLEGSLWHEVMAKYNPPGWLSEVQYPLAYLEDFCGKENLAQQVGFPLPGGRNFRFYKGTWEFEVWPGIWLSWVIDNLRGDYRQFIDYKTKDSPVGFYREGRVQYSDKCRNPEAQFEWVLQLSIYAYATKKLIQLDFTPTPMVWQLYKGVQDSTLSWQPVGIEVLSEADTERECRSNYELFLESWQAYQQEGVEAIKRMPLQGRTMYRNTKCPRYCGQLDACNALLDNPMERVERAG